MANNTITPALPPPPGQTSNLVNPDYIGTKLLAVNCVFLPLAAIALTLRTWTRLFVVHSFRSDDYLMILAFLLSCTLTAVTLEMLNWGMGKHMWDVPLASLSPSFLKVITLADDAPTHSKYTITNIRHLHLNFAGGVIYCAATGLTKVSVLMFYLRIFPNRSLHITVWTLDTIVSGYSFASVLANILSCNPVAKAWNTTISGSCINRPVFYFANAGLIILTDFATVAVPIPLLRRLQMPLQQKIAVGSIMAMGCSVVLVSCTRLFGLYQLLRSTDLTWTDTDALMWCTMELNLGIFGGCVTAIRPFIRKYCPRLLGLSSWSGHASALPRSYGHPLRSIPKRERVDVTNRDRRYPTTLTTLQSTPGNGSEEHILSLKSASHMKEGDRAIGIVRTVEFEVESSNITGR